MAKIIIDQERCKGCNLCKEVCSRGCLLPLTKLNTHGYHSICFTAEDKCSGCGYCYIICPDTCIEVYQ